MEQVLLVVPHWGKSHSKSANSPSFAQMKNTFIEELKKYERKALDVWVTKSHVGAQQASANLRKMI